jgi:hypothetical protein
MKLGFSECARRGRDKEPELLSIQYSPLLYNACPWRCDECYHDPESSDWIEGSLGNMRLDRLTCSSRYCSGQLGGMSNLDGQGPGRLSSLRSNRR